jgi:hypothetical protein
VLETIQMFLLLDHRFGERKLIARKDGRWRVCYASSHALYCILFLVRDINCLHAQTLVRVFIPLWIFSETHILWFHVNGNKEMRFPKFLFKIIF